MTFQADHIDGLVPRRFGEGSEAVRTDLRGLLGVLVQRWRTIALTTLLVCGALLAFALLTTPLYTASTQILIDPRDRRVLQTEVTSTGLGGDTALVESQVRLITSDAILRRVVVELQLAADAEFNRDAASDPDPMARVVERLGRRVSVRRADRTYIIDVRATSRDAYKAARIANAVAAAYLADQAEAAQTTTRRATSALTSRLDELRENLRRAEQAAQDFRRSNNIVGTQGATVTEQQLSEINQRLVLARARAAEAQARVDAVTRVMGRNGAVDPGSISDALASNVVTALRAQFAEISRRESELANQLGPRHPTVLDVRSQLTNIRRLIGEEIGRIAESARTDLSVARAAEQSLQRDLDRLQQRTLETNQSQIRLRELEREVDAARQLYEAFLTRSLQTSEQERMDLVNARIIAPAAVPDRPSFPPRLILLAAGLVGGLGLGVAGAFLREHLDDRLRTPGDVRRRFGLPTLAVLPRLARRGLFGARRGGLDHDVADRPRGPLATAIEALRHDLRDRTGAAPQRSVVVTSATSGDGRTTVATNLALAVAMAGERVLLVDADPATAAISRRIAPDARVGLFEVMAGDIRLADALVRDPRTGLMALPVVSGPTGASDRLSRATVAMLLDAAKPAFDYVVFDTGPLTVDPGARTVADAVDQIVVVVDAEATSEARAAEAFETLRPRDTQRVGVVLNRSATGSTGPA